MHGRNSSLDVIPFARVEKNTTDGGDQLDTAGRTILQLVQRAAGVADETADTRSVWRRSFRISCARLKIEMRSWKQRSPLISKERTGPSNGSIASTPKLKIDFFRRAIALAR